MLSIILKCIKIESYTINFRKPNNSRSNKSTGDNKKIFFKNWEKGVRFFVTIIVYINNIGTSC